MILMRRIYWLWVWLALSFVLFVYGIETGGGPAGLLLYWELQSIGAVFAVTHEIVLLALMLYPFLELLAEAKKRGPRVPFDRIASAKRTIRRSIIGGAIFAILGCLCFLRTMLMPSPNAPPVRIVLDQLSPLAAVEEHESVLVGKPQRAFRVRYTEELTRRFGKGTSFSHDFVPVTRTDWTPDQPIRFLIDTRGNSPSDIQNGLLLRGELPVFVEWALKKKGLRIADDVLVLSTDSDFGRTPWYVCTAFCAILAYAGLMIALVGRLTLRPQKQLEALRPRIGRYFGYAIGGILILFSGILAIQKIVHIATSASTEGVITFVQTSERHPGQYSFYIDYRTPTQNLHGYAFTSTRISKNVGDKVTVIYDPRDPKTPEILTFDDDWELYIEIFTPGAIIVLLAAILFRSKPVREPLVRLQ